MPKASSGSSKKKLNLMDGTPLHSGVRLCGSATSFFRNTDLIFFWKLPTGCLQEECSKRKRSQYFYWRNFTTNLETLNSGVSNRGCREFRAGQITMRWSIT